MPHITISMVYGQNQETKARLAKKVQECVSKELSIEDKYVSVAIEEIAKEEWDGMIKNVNSDIMYVKPGYF